jgi:hypothetical protein
MAMGDMSGGLYQGSETDFRVILRRTPGYPNEKSVVRTILRRLRLPAFRGRTDKVRVHPLKSGFKAR